jgi:acetyl-CoA acyltransferase
MNAKVYITYAQRTATGAFGGQLSTVRVDDLLAHLLSDLKEKANFPLEKIDDCIIGCANQAGEDNRNLARMGLLLAQFPVSIPASTTNRLCGSSLDALISGFAKIKAGFSDCVMVGGAESMSRAPYVLSKAESAFSRQQNLYDTSLGWRFPNPKMEELFGLLSMGETAEEVAETFKINRQRQDQWALRSHQFALKEESQRLHKKEIIPLSLVQKKGPSLLIDTDEGPRSQTSLEKLAQLKPAFRNGGTVTAGNASSLNDGASLVVLVSEPFLKEHRLTPLAEVTGFGIGGVHPNVMGIGPVEAVKRLCERFKMKVNDFDRVELNEAFAAQVLASIDELHLDENKINLHGGAISLGHPLGSSGTRLITTLVHQMNGSIEGPKIKNALATMCIGLGQGIAVSLSQPN